SPILTNEDAQEIKKQLQWIERFPSLKETANAKQTEDYITKLKDLHDYTSVIQQILASCQVTDWGVFESIENVWQTICAELEDWHFIDHAPTIVQKLTSREQMGGMGTAGTTLALYHTRSSTVLQPVFTVYRLKSPLKVQCMQQEVQSIDTILMMLAPDNVSNEVLEVLSFISSLLVQQSG